jgi:hypothetical protein
MLSAKVNMVVEEAHAVMRVVAMEVVIEANGRCLVYWRRCKILKSPLGRRSD